MNVVQSLIDLQETDGQIRELEQEQKDLPARKAQETARLRGVTAELKIAQEALAAQQQRIKECEEESAEKRAKAQQVRIAQATIKSNKELQQNAFQEETLEREADEADARAAALGDDLPAINARIAECQARVEAEELAVGDFVKELDTRLADVNVQLAQLAEERKQKVAACDNKQFLLYYERLRTKRWPVVVTLTADGVCDGCHLKQPPSVEQMVRHNDRLVACTMCGRVLYRD